MQLTYYNTLYKKDVTVNIFGLITFDVDEHNNWFVKFASGGHRYSVAIENIRKIEVEL